MSALELEENWAPLPVCHHCLTVLQNPTFSDGRFWYCQPCAWAERMEVLAEQIRRSRAEDAAHFAQFQAAIAGPAAKLDELRAQVGLPPVHIPDDDDERFRLRCRRCLSSEREAIPELGELCERCAKEVES